jgi:methylase of polypeptide subunit release factors
MYELLYHNLKFEPKVAITDGGEVWDIYARFFASLSKHLRAGGTALLEMDDGAKLAMQKMIRRMLPAWKVAFTKDLGGLWRHIELQKPTK